MKRIFLAIIVFLVFCNSFVFAETRHKPTTAVYTSSSLIKTGDAKVYRIDYIVTSNGGGWAIYDATGATTESSIKTEGSEATANNAKSYDFTTLPTGGLELSTGLYLYIINAKVVITYE